MDDNESDDIFRDAEKAEIERIAKEAKDTPESRDEPVGAVIYIQGVDGFYASVWETKLKKTTQPIIEYTYWIWIHGDNFMGTEILDSKASVNNTLDINFTASMMRSLKGFRFRHFAGNVFRVKFRFDTEKGTVINQDLSLDY